MSKKNCRMIDLETLPKGWTIAKLGDICFTTSGGTPSRKVPNYYGGNIPWVKSGELDKGLILDTEEKITEDAIKNSSAKLFPKGTLLIALYGATVGKLAFLGIDATTNQAVCGIYKSHAVESKLLYYFLQLEKSNLVSQSIGGAQPNISQGIIKDLTIPLAPLNEQKRILAKLEQLLTDLDKGIEYLETTKQQLKVYRQAVLKWAFEGKLTNEHVKDGELPEGWEWKNSGELFSFVTSGSRGWAKYYSKEGAIFIRITNLDFDTLEIDLTPEKIQYVNPPLTSEGIRTKVQEGDFLFSITGYLGMFAIAPKLDNAFVNQHISLCRPKSGYNKKFIGYWIISKSGGYHHLNKLQKGATKAGLGLDDIKGFPIPIAPKEEQDKIVQEIESRLSVCDKIEETIESSLQQAEALRLSIIKKAFEGKLVPQDPNDEPAEKLLERIRATKGNGKPEKKEKVKVKSEKKVKTKNVAV